MTFLEFIGTAVLDGCGGGRAHGAAGIRGGDDDPGVRLRHELVQVEEVLAQHNPGDRRGQHPVHRVGL